MWPRSVSLKRVNYEAGIRDNAANVRSVRNADLGALRSELPLPAQTGHDIVLLEKPFANRFLFNTPRPHDCPQTISALPNRELTSASSYLR